MKDRPATRARGFLIVGIGVLALSPDALLVRLIAADPWTLLFWRGGLMALGLTAVMTIYKGRAFPAALRAVGRAGLGIAVLFTASNICFITSLTHTDVANTLVILSCVPLFAALLSCVFLSETVPLRTWLTILVAIVAVGIIVSQSVEPGNTAGDLAALGAAACQAGAFVVMRRHRTLNMIPAMAISGVFTALAVAPIAAPFGVSARDAGLLAVLGLFVLPVAFGLVTLGPRYLTAPEVGLTMLLEVVLGPIWVWLVIGEQPAEATLIGGSVLLAALAAHYAAALRAPRGARAYRSDKR